MILNVMSSSDINRTLYEKYLFTFKVIIEYDYNLDAMPTQTAFRIPFPDWSLLISNLRLKLILWFFRGILLILLLH